MLLQNIVVFVIERKKSIEQPIDLSSPVLLYYEKSIDIAILLRFQYCFGIAIILVSVANNTAWGIPPSPDKRDSTVSPILAL